MGLYRRFFSYYKPHMALFVLDMSVAVISSFLSVIFPLLTNYLLDGPVADGNVRLMIILQCMSFRQSAHTYVSAGDTYSESG